MQDEPLYAYRGIRPIFKGIWFAHPATPVGAWPVTTAEASGLGGARIAHAATPVFQWPGGGQPTALVLGPSSWGFGIGPWGGTATVAAQQFPSNARPGF